jgi:hypothetical protein
LDIQVMVPLTEHFLVIKVHYGAGAHDVSLATMKGQQ